MRSRKNRRNPFFSGLNKNFLISYISDFTNFIIFRLVFEISVIYLLCCSTHGKEKSLFVVLEILGLHRE